MKKAVLIFSALAAVLFVSCSGLSSAVTEQKSDDITCTIDASSFSSLVGARAAAGTFTIALTMQNASDSTTIQSLTATCTAGGSCTISFDPVTAGTKVVFSGTVTYNGTAIGTISSDGYTIVEGTNTVSLIITPSYAVSVSVDLSSYGVTGSGSIILTLKNNSDSTTQTKTVTGSLSTAQTVTFDTAIATGTSVTASGYVLYSSKEAYYFTDKTFTVSSATGTVSMSGVEAQWLSYAGDTSNTFTGTAYAGLTNAAGTQVFSGYGAGSFATAFSTTGQLYVVSYNSSTCSLYTNGTPYTLSGITTPSSSYLITTSLCYLPDSSGSLLLCMGWGSSPSAMTGTSYFYILTPSSSSYTVTAVTTVSFPSSLIVTSIAAASVDSETCVFFTYRMYYSTGDSSTASSDYNKLYLNAAALKSSYLTNAGGSEFTVSALSSTDTSAFRSGATFTDMMVYNGMLYLLLNDSPIDESYCNFYDCFGLNSRGALVYASITNAVASIKDSTVPSFTVKGWCSAAQTIYGGSTSAGNFYGTATNDYSENCFAGARMFIALKPDAITMADYGVYAADLGSSGTTGDCKEKNATAEFDISGETLSFTALTSSDPDYTYGYYGSMIDGQSFSYTGCTF